MLQTRGRGVMCTSVGSTSKNSRPRPCCRRSLQHCAAMIPFDAAEKKVTEITSGAVENIVVKEGQSIDIKCRPSETGSMIIWFRVLDNSGMEFIASFSSAGVKKANTKSPSSTFTETKIDQNILTLQSFKEAVDSGVYSCATLYRGTELRFGKVTRLVREKVAQPTSTPTDKEQSRCTEAPPCTCSESNNKAEASPSMFCTPLILGPLVGGCGLLLLLLIITTVYCNKIRTKRCPHHYKRKPRTAADGKQMPTRQF
ncbi:T-cell surface glycoprotein CD8 alpha chain isoform X1 [Acanthopagrus latus]|uniref:T-cell surface glycoprotein CD8 alpha chain isoform X1 n=2 Tax=Acanthopagrus latus TaxID=8177 RepID=UPI00187C5A60|nr:T-cell surface glycoprotein CD8 alpha chain isoform X1 [Acanthopagrus latus]